MTNLNIPQHIQAPSRLRCYTRYKTFLLSMLRVDREIFLCCCTVNGENIHKTLNDYQYGERSGKKTQRRHGCDRVAEDRSV